MVMGMGAEHCSFVLSPAGKSTVLIGDSIPAPGRMTYTATTSPQHARHF